MRVDIVVVSDSDKQFSSAIDEYIKRMSSQVTIHTLKPVKHGSVDQIKQKESVMIVQKIKNLLAKQEWVTVLLSHRWDSLISEKFAELCSKNHRYVFVVWWAYGLDEDVLSEVVNHKISFGKQTMPHGLVKLVLMEQLRRAHTIHINKKYHY